MFFYVFYINLHHIVILLLKFLLFCPQDPAVATSKRAGNLPYESYDRGTEKNAWVTDSDGKTPLLGEVRCVCV